MTDDDGADRAAGGAKLDRVGGADRAAALARPLLRRAKRKRVAQAARYTPQRMRRRRRRRGAEVRLQSAGGGSGSGSAVVAARGGGTPRVKAAVAQRLAVVG